MSSISLKCLIALLAAALLPCCDADSPTEPETDRPAPFIVMNTHVIDAGGEFTLLHRDGDTFVIRPAAEAPRIAFGHIILGTDGGGFISRVTRVRETPTALVLETTPASVTDAIVVGDIDMTIAVGTGSPPRRDEANGTRVRSARGWTARRRAPGVMLAEDGLDLGGVTLLDTGTGERPGTISITNGTVSFDPTVTIGASVRGASIERLTAAVGGALRFDCDLSVDLPEPIEAAGEVPLAAFSARCVRHVGPVPVVVTVTLSFAVGYEVFGAYAGECDIRFAAAAHTTLSSSYRSGDWRDNGGIDGPVLEAAPLNCGAYADIDIDVELITRIEVSFYAEPAMELRAGPRVRVRAATPAEPVWEWSIEGGIRLSSFVGGAILDEDFLPHAAVPASIEAPIRSGPFSTDEFTFVTSWGSPGEGDGRFIAPRSIAADAARNIYVLDSHAQRVQVFRPDSAFVTSWGGQGTGEGAFAFPQGIAVDAAGDVYVVDTDNHRVQKFRPDGTFLTAWGGEGMEDGRFKDPQGIAAGIHGDIYVTDCFTHRIQRFTTDGTFLSAWGDYGTGSGRLACPVGIAVGGSGTVYVGECNNHRVQAFTGDGTFVRMWGRFGTEDGAFNCPIDVAVDENGTVYVVDYGNDRIQMFTPAGELIATLGSTGSGDGRFIRPEGIAVDVLGQLYIVDSENRRVQRFAPNPR